MSGSAATETVAALTRGDRQELDLGPLVHGGLCLSHLADGTIVFVDGGIPGERVVVELSYRKKKAWFGRVVDTITASEHRVAAPCPYVGQCGGCQLQHVSYSRQLSLKREVVLDAIGRQRVELPPTVGCHGMSDPWRYRWRGEFHVIPGEVGMADAELGFNRVRSWSKVAVDDCLIHHRTITNALPALRQLARGGGRSGLSTLHLTVGEGGDELLVRAKPAAALDAVALDTMAVSQQPRWSAQATTLHWREMTFRVASDSFIQVNWAQMDVLYSLVLEGLGDITGCRLVDAYSGIGVMSCALAATAREVICIESNPHACRMGVLNARLNGVSDRLRYVARPVEDALAGVLAADRADAVILDPPRAGCESTVCGYLALAGPATIVYVSCDPATLARDLGLLCRSGPYRLERLDVVDMFPQTYHVETVAVLRREPSGATGTT